MNIVTNIINFLKEKIKNEEMKKVNNSEQIDAFILEETQVFIDKRTTELQKAFEYIENRKKYEKEIRKLNGEILDITEQQIKPLEARIYEIEGNINYGKNQLQEYLKENDDNKKSITIDDYYYELKEEIKIKREIDKKLTIELLGRLHCENKGIIKNNLIFNEKKLLENVDIETLQKVSNISESTALYLQETNQLNEIKGE